MPPQAPISEGVATRPLVVVDASRRLRHVIRFHDEGHAQWLDSKADDASGCEIWMKVGHPEPGDPEATQFVAIAADSPYTVEFPAENVGAKVSYFLRWTTDHGNKGPWSTRAGATVEG
jgi:hypothetical protein